MKISRRHFLYIFISTAFIFVGFLVFGRNRPFSKRNIILQEQLEIYIKDFSSARKIGYEYLKLTPVEKNVDVLVESIFPVLEIDRYSKHEQRFIIRREFSFF